jgi:hypothetical protein
MGTKLHRPGRFRVQRLLTMLMPSGDTYLEMLVRLCVIVQEKQKLQQALEDQALTQGPNLEPPPRISLVSFRDAH